MAQRLQKKANRSLLKIAGIGITIVLLGFAGLPNLFRFFKWLEWLPQPQISDLTEISAVQRIYETGSLAFGVTTIIVTGIAVTTPLIMMTWSQVLDSVFELIITVRNGNGSILQEAEGKEMIDDLTIIFLKASKISKWARLTLLCTLYFAIALLVFLLYVSSMYNKTTLYYEYLTFAITLSVAVSIPFVFVIIMLMSAAALNIKVKNQCKVATIIQTRRVCNNQAVEPQANSSDEDTALHKTDISTAKVLIPALIFIFAVFGIVKSIIKGEIKGD